MFPVLHIFRPFSLCILRAAVSQRGRAVLIRCGPRRFSSVGLSSSLFSFQGARRAVCPADDCIIADGSTVVKRPKPPFFVELAQKPPGLKMIVFIEKTVEPSHGDDGKNAENLCKVPKRGPKFKKFRRPGPGPVKMTAIYRSKRKAPGEAGPGPVTLPGRAGPPAVDLLPVTARRRRRAGRAAAVDLLPGPKLDNTP